MTQLRDVMCCGLACCIIQFAGCSPPTKESHAQDDKRSESKSDLLQDFKAVGVWCEQANLTIAKASGANAIRGDDLKQQKLKQFRNELLQKAIRWRFKVYRIDRSQGVFVQSYYRTSQGELVLSVGFQDRKHYAGQDIGFNPCYAIQGISEPKMRSLTNGEEISVTGNVTSVNVSGGIWSVDVRNSTIE